MALLLPDDIKNEVVTFVKGDDIRRLYVEHIFACTINGFFSVDTRDSMAPPNDGRKVNLDKAVRDFGKNTGVRPNKIFLTRQFEETLLEYERSDLSINFHRFLDKNLFTKNEGSERYDAGEELLEDIKKYISSLKLKKFQTAVKYAVPVTQTVQTSSSSTSSTTVSTTDDDDNHNLNDRSNEIILSSTVINKLIIKILDVAPLLIASFSLFKELNKLRDDEKALQHAIANYRVSPLEKKPNEQAAISEKRDYNNVESLKLELDVVRKQIALCNEGTFISFLNQHPEYQVIFHTFSTTFKNAFKDDAIRLDEIDPNLKKKPVNAKKIDLLQNFAESIMQDFNEAIIGQLRNECYVHGLMHGELELLTKFLKDHKLVTSFLINNINALQGASDAFIRFSAGAYNYNHIDLQMRHAVQLLVSEIKCWINTICDERAANLSPVDSVLRFFSKNQLFEAVDKCNTNLRLTLNNVSHYFAQENNHPGQVLIFDAAKSLRMALQSENQKLTDAFNNKGFSFNTQVDRDFFTKLNTTLDKLYQKADLMTDKAYVFSKIYKYVPNDEITHSQPALTHE